MSDIPFPEDQFEKIKQKYITAKNVKNKYKNPTQKIQSQYKKAKRRFEIAQQVISNSPRPRTRSPMNRESSVVTPIRKHTPSKKQYQKRLDKEQRKMEWPRTLFKVPRSIFFVISMCPFLHIFDTYVTNRAFKKFSGLLHFTLLSFLQYLNNYLGQLINLKHITQYLNNYLGQLINLEHICNI